MRRGVWAVLCVASIACGARSDISSDDSSGGGAFDDATIDVAQDAPTDAKDGGTDAKDGGAPESAVADASPDAEPEAGGCCDLGMKLSGCQTCEGGDTCWNKVGTCMHTVPNCGPWNCDGCCEWDTVCADGREVASCGTHGQMCQECYGAKVNTFVACVPGVTGGTCAGGPTCTHKNCPMGCCNGDVCMLGDVDTLCGHGGDTCADCTKSSGYCDGSTCDIPRL